jgi:DNA-binding winged helix-turn-helix (wHTH) protein
MMKRGLKRFYVFGLFRIDVTERILFREQSSVPLTPKAFETLLALVENSGHVLSKDELMERVWPDTAVEENNLAQNISALRKALGEAAGGQKFIATVPRRGYRFVAEVRESIGGTSTRVEASSDNKMPVDYNQPPHARGDSFRKDVVLIGRAIDFK